jgi:tRNA (mo5U34)-methyltransferase
MDQKTEALALAADSSIVWHQAFDLVPGVRAPGVNDIEWLLARSGIDTDLHGKSVLDIGTTNGAVAFTAEERGASRVVAVDICPIDWFGFDRIRDMRGSQVEFLQASVYELPQYLTEQFDLVVFWGVLYHLRHPLLALDSVRRLAGAKVSVETAVSSNDLGTMATEPVVRFHRHEFHGDSSNWFTPSVSALEGWMGSCGFRLDRVDPFPDADPTRCLVNASVVDGPPEYQQVSYERPLIARSDVS